MKFRPFLACCLLAVPAMGAEVDDLFDRLDDALTVSARNGDFRARLSGTLDLEAWHFTGPAIGLVDSERRNLFTPRLTLFLDGQLGRNVYLFAQVRADRGFDPSDGTAELRLDEYALRLTPWEDGRVNLQIGKFATVVGNWVGRHLPWDNPFITAPIPYEGVTGASDLEVPFSARDLRSAPAGEKYDHLPIIWGPSYTTGLSIAGRMGKLDYALEVKNAALSSRPESWDATSTGFGHPTVSGRVGFRPDAAWNLGLSASRGSYLQEEASAELPPGRGIDDYIQWTLGQDVSFAWHHWQLWAEFYEARFEIPNIGNADTFAYYLEAKYKFTPQIFGALRWNQQLFGSVEGVDGREAWSRDLWRVDAALAWRPLAHAQLKLQYSLQQGGFAAEGLSHTVAAQLTIRF